MIFILLALLCFSGCTNDDKQFLPVPRYLTKQNIRLNTSQINVKTNRKENIAPELVRMLGMNPMKFMAEWIDSKIDAVGGKGEVIISFPKIEIIEENVGQYVGKMKVVLTFQEDGQNLKQISAIVNALKGFDPKISYLKRKYIMYDLLQELIASAHDSIIYELKKIN